MGLNSAHLEEANMFYSGTRTDIQKGDRVRFDLFAKTVAIYRGSRSLYFDNGDDKMALLNVQPTTFLHILSELCNLKHMQVERGERYVVYLLTGTE